MPIVKASEPLGPRPVIIAWYGDPGIGKTTLCNTCQDPLLVDGDRGVSRSILRKDTLIPDSWDEVLKYEKDGAFKGYKTVGIDTPKAVLDDFLMSYVIRTDPKLQKNKLGAYGAIGSEFALFLNNRRQDQADIAIICHARKDDDTKRMIPDVTGQSLNLILRVADMIGYYTIYNGKRMLFFEPSETTFGKNVACLPPIEVPDKTDPAFATFMSGIYEKVREAIATRSEEQLAALQQSAQCQADIAACETPVQLTELLKASKALPDYLRVPIAMLIIDKAREKSWVANKQTLCYELPAGQPSVSSPAKPVAGANASPAAAGPGNLDTPYDDRCIALAEAGLAGELDQMAGLGFAWTYDQIGDWSKKEYMENLALAHEAAKKPKPRRQPPKAIAQTQH